MYSRQTQVPLMAAFAMREIADKVSLGFLAALETQLPSDRDIHPDTDINLNHASCPHADNLSAGTSPADNHRIDQRENVQSPAEQPRNKKRLREADKAPKKLRQEGENNNTEITKGQIANRRYKSRRYKSKLCTVPKELRLEGEGSETEIPKGQLNYRRRKVEKTDVPKEFRREGEDSDTEITKGELDNRKRKVRKTKVREEGENSDTKITRAQLYRRSDKKRKNEASAAAGTAVSYAQELLDSREGDQQGLQR